MSLKYDANESAALVSALRANLSTARTMLTAAGSACDRLTGALGGSQLSGKGYSAAKTLFAESLKPGMSRMEDAIEALHNDVDVYSRADSLVSQYGDLDEIQLQAQMVAVLAQKNTTERMVEANQLLWASAQTVPGLSTALSVANSRLELLLSGFQEDLRELDDKLLALAAFDRQTSALFIESLTALAQSSRKVAAVARSGGKPTNGAVLAGLKLGKSGTRKKIDALLKEHLTPAEVAALWKASELTPESLESLPPDVLLKLASLSGLPAAVQDFASRELLTWALEEAQLDKAYALFGFTEDWRIQTSGNVSRMVNLSSDVSKYDFLKQLQALASARDQAEDDAKALGGNPIVQLIGLGNHDGVLVAGISFGNIDTASNLGVNVSGMGSNLGDMETGNDAVRSLYANAYEKKDSASYAVVNWVGYRPPVITDWNVWGMERAESGGKRLASFLDGIHASRESLSTVANQYPQQLNVYAHSYGSTTAFEALKQTNFSVSLVATYGSAGVNNDTVRAEINADRVYATKAPGVFGDGLDNLGRIAGPKTLDPIDIPGVIVYSSRDDVSELGEKLKKTTVHDMYREKDAVGGLNWGGATGYMTENATSLDRMGSMLAKGTAK